MIASSERSRPLVLQSIEIPPPVYFVSVEAESAATQPALDAALEALTREDPSLSVRQDRDTGQTLLCGSFLVHDAWKRYDSPSSDAGRELHLDNSQTPQTI